MLPVGSLQNELLELLFILVFDGLTTFLLVLLKTLLCLKEGVLDHELACFEEVVEGHGAVLLVLSLAKLLTFGDELVDDLLGWLGFLKLCLFF